jgi:hypothetical protein
MVSSDACYVDDATKEAACAQVITRVALDVQVEEVRVHCFASCGSLIFDIYIETRNDNPNLLQTKVNTVQATAAHHPPVGGHGPCHQSHGISAVAWVRVGAACEALRERRAAAAASDPESRRGGRPAEPGKVCAAHARW